MPRMTTTTRGIVLIAAVASLALAACTPPLPPDVLAAKAETNITCQTGNVDVTVPEDFTGSMDAVGAALAGVCPEQTITENTDQTDSKLRLVDHAPTAEEIGGLHQGGLPDRRRHRGAGLRVRRRAVLRRDRPRGARDDAAGDRRHPQRDGDVLGGPADHRTQRRLRPLRPAGHLGPVDRQAAGLGRGDDHVAHRGGSEGLEHGRLGHAPRRDDSSRRRPTSSES